MKSALFGTATFVLLLAGCGNQDGASRWLTAGSDPRVEPPSHPAMFFDPAQRPEPPDKPLTRLCSADGQPVPMAVLLPCGQTTVRIRT
jgi:hypothetical protein